MFGFGCLFIIFRSVGSLILGVLIFFAFLAFLLISTFRDNFLTADFYNESLSDNAVYTRVYDEVLLDDEFRDTTNRLLGDIDVAHDDIVGVSREIITPEYLQEEVEGAVHGTIDYLNKETDDPSVFINLGPPLERVKPVLFDYIDGRIDALQDVPVNTMEELRAELEDIYRTIEAGQIPDRIPLIVDPEALVNNYVDGSIAQLEEVPVTTAEDLQAELENAYQELATGQLPTRIPSLDLIPADLRITAYDQVLRVMADLAQRDIIPIEAVEGLQRQEEAVKSQLREGTIIGALEVASRPLTRPTIDKFVDDGYDLAVETLKGDARFRDDPLFQKALDGLEARADEVKGHLGAGRIKDSLKVGARGLAEPLIDDTLDELREELDDQERLDLVATAAEQNNQTRAQFLDDIDPLRDVIERSDVSIWLALLLIVGATLMMAVIHIPHINSALRWPGLTLLLSGLVFLIIGLVLNSQLPDRFDDLLDRGATAVSPIPPSMIDVVNDVLTSMASDVTSAFILPSIILMVVGFVLLLGSIIVRMLHIPILSR